MAKAKFMRRCDNEEPHGFHEYVKHWRKVDLPYMPEQFAAKLPDEWDAEYQCKGIAPAAFGGPR